MDVNRKKSKKVEELIQKYSIDLFKYNIDENEEEEYIMLRDDFDQLISDIRQIHISNNYLGLMSWLVNRAFMITPGVRRNDGQIQSVLNKNKSLLLKVLYDISPKQLLQVLSKNS